jgi:hypothetical protein
VLLEVEFSSTFEWVLGMLGIVLEIISRHPQMRLKLDFLLRISKRGLAKKG